MRDDSQLHRSFAGLRHFWSDATLTRRFVLAGGFVMLTGMITVGSWVGQRIESSVVRNNAASAANYVESFISPLSQQLAEQDFLDPRSAAALDVIFNNTPFGKRIVTLKIWKPGGLIVHANDPDIIGQVFPVVPNMRNAWNGRISASFSTGDSDQHDEDVGGLPLLEIYSPVRAADTNQVIAVAEFYEVATQLENDIRTARVNSWLIVFSVMATMSMMLVGIVMQGSRIIEKQKADLQAQIGTLRNLAAQNDALRRRAERASARITEGNERYLRKIAADLHDGPAQLLGFISLRLDTLRDQSDAEAHDATVDSMSQVLSEAMTEIRDISRGLSLPHIEDLPLAGLLERATSEHATRTSSAVALDTGNIGDLLLPQSFNICVFRFIQEGLANALRHGKGVEQTVTATVDGERLQVEVSDKGPGTDKKPRPDDTRSGLGLPGMRERAESLGGQFTFRSAPGEGATVTLTLKLPKGSQA